MAAWSVYSMPWVGLVIEGARQAAPGHPDGAWFVDLTAARDSAQLVDTISSALGLGTAEAAGTAGDALRSYTRGRCMLLVLDKCEQVPTACADLVESLLSAGSELTVAATSREPLGVEGEAVLPLGPLPTPAAG